MAYFFLPGHFSKINQNEQTKKAIKTDLTFLGIRN